MEIDLIIQDKLFATGQLSDGEIFTDNKITATSDFIEEGNFWVTSFEKLIREFSCIYIRENKG